MLRFSLSYNLKVLFRTLPWVYVVMFWFLPNLQLFLNVLVFNIWLSKEEKEKDEGEGVLAIWIP